MERKTIYYTPPDASNPPIATFQWLDPHAEHEGVLLAEHADCPEIEDAIEMAGARVCRNHTAAFDVRRTSIGAITRAMAKQGFRLEPLP